MSVVAAVPGGRKLTQLLHQIKSSLQFDPAQHNDTVLEKSTSTDVIGINMRAHAQTQVAAQRHGGCAHMGRRTLTRTACRWLRRIAHASELMGMKWPYSVLHVLDHGPLLTAV